MSVVASIHHEEELDLGEDFFAWPHPTNSGEALFMVDDTLRAREIASRGREGVQATLAKMSNAITVVARLGTEAQRQMINKVVA